ncbi:hypothetical protein GW746_01050, partial [Candidatus Saccharibacteria bacterium]|nr:hypothetical protein [Candidatus Saccharibacteria bacterium]
VVGDACTNPANADSAICQNADDDIGGVIGIIVNTLLYILGAVSVLMIIIAGIRFATSGSDASSVQSAKNTILYAVVGLVVAFLAYAIVNWVFNLFG